jgi:aspartate/methionine/tyrosine aminotransferase
MKPNTTGNLHKTSYQIFRHYLDVVYDKNKERPIIPLSLGYPLPGVFPLPIKALQKLSPLDKKGIEKRRPGYGWEMGSRSLRETIIEYENKRHSTHYDLSNICMSAGGSYALNRVLEYLFKHMESKKNELIVAVPTFYRMLGRVEEYAIVKNMLTRRINLYQPTISDISQYLSRNTRAIFFCNPSNPGYNYISKNNLRKLVRYLERKKVYLVIDEVGDNFFHTSFFRYPTEIQSPYVIRICSSSKAYQLAEYRLGYVIGERNFIGNKTKGFIKLIGDDMGNPPLAANDAWQYMLREEINWIDSDRETELNEYQKVTKANEKKLKNKCDIVVKYLRSSPYVSDIILPDSSFNLTFQFISKELTTDVNFFLQLLEKKCVSLVPCSSFGFEKKDKYMRLTFAIPDKQLEEGLKRIVSFLKEIN